MHESVITWVRTMIRRHSLAGKRVLEVGALDVNGTVRGLFEAAEYIGIDMRPGANVDMVMNAHQLAFQDEKFDIVISTETLEHDEYFWLTAAEMGRVLKKGGILIVTARGNGFPLHGYPDDYWRFMPSSARTILNLAGASLLDAVDDPQVSGIFAIGVKPLPISVLMPVNSTTYLSESIASVKSQSYLSWELLIGVNGTQGDKNVLNAAKIHDDERIKVFDLDLIAGYANAMNELVKRASYDHVALIDQDDVWHAEKLAHQVPLLQSYDVVGTMAEYFGTRSGRVPIPEGRINAEVFSSVNPIVNPSAILRRSDALWDASYGGVCDYDLWTRLALAGRAIFNMPEVLVRHRIHPESEYNNRDFSQKIAEIRRRAASIKGEAKR